MNAKHNQIEWESEIEYDDNDGEYDRSARGKLIIDGPEGRLIALKRYRAMVDESKGLLEPGKITEHSTYYRENESDPFTDGTAEWDVSEELLADEDAFVDECLTAVEVDPQVEYEQHMEER